MANGLRGAYVVYVGTWTLGRSEGIYSFELDMSTGELRPLGVVPHKEKPGYLALHPNGRFLYAVNELESCEAGSTGKVASFAIGPERGQLRLLNQQITHGAYPCHLSVERTGRAVFAVSYGGSCITVFPINGSGELEPASQRLAHAGTGKDPARQVAPHPHCIRVDAANRFALSADLGIDRIVVYRIETEGGRVRLRAAGDAALAPGSGPRHVAFHPGGGYVYAVNELNSTVTAFRYNAEVGALVEIETISTLPSGYDGENSPAAIHFHPSGDYLYISNRGHDSIAVFRKGAGSGRLELVAHEPTRGLHTREFAIDPTGKFFLCANQESDEIVTFAIDPGTGRLAPTGWVTRVPTPTCVLFAEAGADSTR